MGDLATHPFTRNLSAMLKAKPKLKFDYAPGQSTQGSPEVSRISEVGVAASARLEGRKVENVEDIEEVGAGFEIRRFAKAKESRQSRLFDQT